MRTYDQLCAAVASCGLPYARISWDPLDPSDIPALPHVLLVPQKTRNAIAADGVACRITPYDVELYAKGSDIALEESVESALSRAGFSYNRYTVPLGDGIVETVWGGLDCIGI